MLRAGKVGLRARDEADVAILHAELYEDIATRVRADSRPWLPIPAGSAASPYAVGEPRDDVAVFSVVELADGELAGEALLWAIDLHNRSAHLGVSLRPAFRGRGLGADVVAALCEYGFAVRGLHRLQVDTLAGNTAMIRAAERAGFVPEGRRRQAAWAGGDFVDAVILGLLAAGWDGGRRRSRAWRHPKVPAAVESSADGGVRFSRLQPMLRGTLVPPRPERFHPW
jgi:RimJ/RimL family protein N-acetyltransferase